jgi:CRISPR system Cascade subunit CasA
MTKENRFNLINEPWLPIADVGLVSLRQVFCHSEYRALGGNPVQKIAVIKLLLAIAQAAATPTDDAEWGEMGAAGMAQRCLAYLDQWHDRFWLYGKKPFLQVPAIAPAGVQSAGAVLAEVATGNTTVLTEINIDKPLSEAEQALLLVCLTGFALGGKKTDNSVVLSTGYAGKANEKGKPATAKPGAALGFYGFLHSFLLGPSLRESLWLNMLTHEQIDGLRVLTAGLGQAPWERMPSGESCAQAQQLQNSLMGYLLPLSRFCLLTDGGLHYSEGIAHHGYKEGMIAPSVSVNYSGKDTKVLWVDPEKRPWRFLSAMLSFLSQNAPGGFDCLQLRSGLLRSRRQVEALGVWSGGLRVSNNAGEQFVSGADDFVESTVMLPLAALGEAWFAVLQQEMSELDGLSKIVYSATWNYGKTLKADNKGQAGQAGNLFWQLCERQFQRLVDGCDDPGQILQLRRIFAGFVSQCYNRFCPNDTSRQLDAWAKNQPNLSRYLKDQTKPQEGNA